jgi:hypothetical protein
MSFQSTGHIVQIKDAEQVSDKFTKREFAIKIDDGGKYDNFASFQAVQDRCSILDNFAEGDEVTVHFDVRGREWQGRYFTNLQCLAGGVERCKRQQGRYKSRSHHPTRPEIPESWSRKRMTIYRFDPLR